MYIMRQVARLEQAVTMTTKVYAVFLPEIIATRRGKGKPQLWRRCIGWAKERKVKKEQPKP